MHLMPLFLSSNEYEIVVVTDNFNQLIKKKATYKSHEKSVLIKTSTNI